MITVFENDVKTYSIQTQHLRCQAQIEFENDVKTYSIQTQHLRCQAQIEFENDVKTYSIQTEHQCFTVSVSLRMM